MPDDTPKHRYTATFANQIEPKWQAAWDASNAYVTPNPGDPTFDASKPKFYCLDMFPYPSGAGLHVGHPEGYTATDIVCRYKRAKGFNVLHPMGYDAFGLPAEQYAIQTGVHPALTTKKSIETFRRQLKRFGFSYDWSREFATIDPDYYKWTQWVFLRLYDTWVDLSTGKARPISELESALEAGTAPITPAFDWKSASKDQRRTFIDSHRLAYLAEATVNWCPKLGTVLANDEVIDGKSERGGHPVIRRPLRQWMFRITAMAERLLTDLNDIDWPSSTKTMQSEWIGKSEGAEIDFQLSPGTPPVPGGLLGTPPVPGGRTTSNPTRTAEILTEGLRRIKAHGRGGLTPTGFLPRDPYPPGVCGAVENLESRRRNLPHHRLDGATYFVTWHCINDITLTDQDRDLTLSAMRHFEGERYQTYAAVVMSNHVHWIVRPLGTHTLDSIVTGVKQFSARGINAASASKGHVWDAESFDHIVRDLQDFAEHFSYVVENPVKAGVVAHADRYEWTYAHPEILGGLDADRDSPAGDRRDTQDTLRVFTTRPDTIFGATYMVVAPEHPLVAQAIAAPSPRTDANKLRNYVEATRSKSEVDRQADSKTKTGVDTGYDAINPATGKPIPIWTADYVLMGYGTGAIMAVPAHDDRDFDFANAFALPIVQVLDLPSGKPWDAKSAFTADSTAINSSSPELTLDKLPTDQAKQAVIAWLERTNRGTRRINYRLRDWAFSRQRYWGEPFPIVYDAAGNHYPISEPSLPVVLPDLEDYSPAESDEPQPLLAKATTWVNTTAGAAGVDPALLAPSTPVRRETNTMPGSAGSSWYFLRYIDAHNNKRFVGRDAERYWMVSKKSDGQPHAGGIDLYMGGSEHAVGHLLYSRFWHKVLFDLGEVSTPEPFGRLFHQGMITSFAYQRPDKSLVPNDMVDEIAEGKFVERATGTALTPIVAKMSKSLKNVINPDDVIAEYGADTFRLYEMYMGPLDASKPWNPRDIIGMFRFLQKLWRIAIDEDTGELREAVTTDANLEKHSHRMVAKVATAIEALSFNTAIAAMIEFVNMCGSGGPGSLTRAQLQRLAVTLSPFAPHLAEEVWTRAGGQAFASSQPWPQVDPKQLIDDEVEMPVQVNGKLRGKVIVPAKADAKTIESIALTDEKVTAAIEGKPIKKVIVVPGKMVNFIV